ncbi:hypothetical protein GCM10011579_020400 [Streptomyces albiflavescens]|uniref:Uncharacterized protein n=1 Tax=Streptomyces albiflavescens TaxID=1623582 RepID=A0A917XYH9_9ACTN|nr:hypothetical protein GCM10011579_020400 [Streptomyces albiflavescens]
MSMTRQAEPTVTTPPVSGPKEADLRTTQRSLALRLLARPEVGVFLGAVLAAPKHELAQVRGVDVEELPEEEDLTATAAATAPEGTLS